MFSTIYIMDLTNLHVIYLFVSTTISVPSHHVISFVIVYIKVIYFSSSVHVSDIATVSNYKLSSRRLAFRLLALKCINDNPFTLQVF